MVTVITSFKAGQEGAALSSTHVVGYIYHIFSFSKQRFFSPGDRVPNDISPLEKHNLAFFIQLEEGKFVPWYLCNTVDTVWSN